jgi:hypothetical protein
MLKHIRFGAFILLAASSSQLVNAQKLQLNVFGGFSNYQGDLQDKRFTTKQSHGAFGGGLIYDLSNHFSARANATFGKISGDDKNGVNKLRNLNFTSKISDYHLGLEYRLFDFDNHYLTPYVFAGVSYFTFDPYTTNAAGTTVKLRPLSTEGQGFYNGRKAYKTGQFAIPFGGGLKWAASDNFLIGAEVGLRKTNTDYLDDVSTTYVDQALLLANRGPQAVELAYRRDDIDHTPYPADGEQRGSAKSKDWYYFGGINLIFRLNGNGGGGSSRKGLGCPGRL